MQRERERERETETERERETERETERERERERERETDRQTDRQTERERESTTGWILLTGLSMSGDASWLLRDGCWSGEGGDDSRDFTGCENNSGPSRPYTCRH